MGNTYLVNAHHERTPGFVPKLLQVSDHLTGHGAVQPGGGFVEKHALRRAKKRARDRCKWERKRSVFP